MMKRILITGAAGYIGSIVSRLLLRKSYEVIGFDNLMFGGESLVSIFNHPNFSFINGDVRDKNLVGEILETVDSVVHLAAIVGDPACSKQPELAKEINWKATKQIYDLSKDNTNIKKFVFASTCSNYGKMDGDVFLNEESPLNPVSLYAELKVKFEKYLLESITRSDFIPTSLRFSTVYGLSPRIRFDLTVNEFTRELALGKELLIFGEQFWRPYCHVNDLALSVVLVLESEEEKVNHQVFGVGDTNENYQKKMLAKELMKIIPDCKIKYIKKDEDPRDYRVNFNKIKNELGFEITKTVPDGIRETYSLLKSSVLSDPYDKKYRNI
jgi:nucleoside-diphosphate-sugar epimerase